MVSWLALKSESLRGWLSLNRPGGIVEISRWWSEARTTGLQV